MTIIVQYVLFSVCCISASVGKMFANLSLATVVVHCTYTLFNLWIQSIYIIQFPLGQSSKVVLVHNCCRDWLSLKSIGARYLLLHQSQLNCWLGQAPQLFTKNLQHCLMCKMLHKQPEVVKLWLRTLSTSPMRMCEFTASCQSMQHLDIITNAFCMQILLNIIFLIWNEALYVGLFPYLFATMEKK